jgi:phage shock protein PspC (stress-responsive transcriptional regulator)
MKRLERSRESSVIGGVCGGLGEYFNIDPVIFRIAFIILALAEGVGVVAYVICWIAIPRRPEGKKAEVVTEDKDESRAEWVKYLPGAGLIFIGLIFLLEDSFYWFSFQHLWPLILVVVGAVLIIASVNRKEEKTVSERGES